MKLPGCWKSVLIVCLAVSACDRGHEAEDGPVRSRVYQALDVIGLDENALSVPRLGMPYSTPGRLAVVDAAMKNPLSLQDLGERLLMHDPDIPMSVLIERLVQDLGFSVGTDNRFTAEDLLPGQGLFEAPAGMAKTSPELASAIKLLLDEAVLARQAYMENGGSPSGAELEEIKQHLTRSISYAGNDPEAYWLMPRAYHSIGARADIDSFASMAVSLLAVADQAVNLLKKVGHAGLPLEWETPHGRVLVAGNGNDVHSGDYLLLIDLAGDDRYENIGRKIQPGQISIVIDMEGDDEVLWDAVPGPASGVMGAGLWVDVSGDDVFRGSNMGLGTALFGTGVFWDQGGDDSYHGRAMVQGAGQYGIAIMIDEAGDDSYHSGLAGQGFGGPGGLGLQLDLAGNDQYVCGGEFPDQAKARTKRHTADHYLGMCQGYSFGIRPEVSGGIGLLLDMDGDDSFTADLFAQGGALWFGLGMLVDRHGNDVYRAFEHAQGESLHLGAGFLGDWGGDDSYEGYEHCQGVGLDRAVGYLYDHTGDDTYVSGRDSQGTGLEPFGVGLLVDAAGDDRFVASSTSQGYSARPSQKFPESQWPVGILLDLGGVDLFEQPDVAPPDAEGRIRNKQGIAIKL